MFFYKLKKLIIMYLNIEKLRDDFEKEKGMFTFDYPFTYIEWLEAKLINSEKNNAKTPVIKSVCECCNDKGYINKSDGFDFGEVSCPVCD